MASKTAAAAKAAKSKTKAPPPKKPVPVGKPAAKAAPVKAAPAKVPLKAGTPGAAGKAAAGAAKGAVSNVEAIKAVAIKAGAAKGAAAPAAVTPAPDGETSDSPLLDLSDAAVRKMIKNAKKRGYVTYEQLNGVLPSEEVTSEKIEDVLAMLNEMGINVVESEEAGEEEGAEDDDDDDDAGGDLVETSSTKSVAETKKSEPGERTDDPVRMYLREMGSVELLSREGEIAIAKRIEAGREAMIAGLCESPLTFQAIIIWRDELNEGKVFLRDIIDLEATYAGPDAVKGMANPNAPGVPGQPGVPGAMPAAAAPGAILGRPRARGSAAVGAARRDPVPPRRLPPADAARLPPERQQRHKRHRSPPRARRARRSAMTGSTTTRWRIRSRSPRSRPSSSRR